MSVLITGGAGYIGSHTCIEMLNAGYEVVVVDNLDNSSSESLKRVEKITGKTLKFYKEDVRNKEALRKIFSENEIEAVIHFAGLKAVGESVQKPIMYYDKSSKGAEAYANLGREILGEPVAVEKKKFGIFSRAK